MSRSLYGLYVQICCHRVFNQFPSWFAANRRFDNPCEQGIPLFYIKLISCKQSHWCAKLFTNSSKYSYIYECQLWNASFNNSVV